MLSQHWAQCGEAARSQEYGFGPAITDGVPRDLENGFQSLWASLRGVSNTDAGRVNRGMLAGAIALHQGMDAGHCTMDSRDNGEPGRNRSCRRDTGFTGPYLTHRQSTPMNLPLSLFPLGWQHYLLGGGFIGTGTALLFMLTGRIGGMSTVFSSTWSFVLQRPFFQQARLTDSRGWRLVYAAGLILGALVWWLGFSGGAAQTTQVPAWQLLVGGFFVGYGARLGNGCTSGHGICGLGSLQLPSLMAVLTFMATAFLTANLAARFLA